MNALINRLTPLFTPQRMRYPWLIGAALWGGWLLSLAAGAAGSDRFGQLIGADFVAFYSAGKILLLGRSAELYNLALSNQIQQQIYAVPSQNFNPYLNPPFYAGLFVPFALLPHAWSAILWMLSMLLCAAFSISLLSQGGFWRKLGLSLTWLPAWAAISFGQNTFLSLLIFSLCWRLWREEHPFRAGLVFGLLVYKPQLMLGLGFLWLLAGRRGWRALGGAALSAGGLGLLSLLWMPEATFAYLQYAWQISGNLQMLPAFPIWNAHGVQSFWLALLGGQKAAAQWLYLICALVGLVAYGRFYRQVQQTDLRFAGAVCLSIWLTPYIMVYDWALLLLPAILLWQHAPSEQAAWRILFSVLWIGMFLSSALTALQWRSFGVALQISLPLLALVLGVAMQRLTGRNAMAPADV